MQLFGKTKEMSMKDIYKKAVIGTLIALAVAIMLNYFIGDATLVAALFGITPMVIILFLTTTTVRPSEPLNKTGDYSR